MLGIFSALFVYLQFGKSVPMTLVYFLISSAVMVLVLPWGGKLISMLGSKNSVIIGSICLAISNIVFLFWQYDLYLWMSINILFLTLSRILLRVPFRISLALSTTDESRGMEIGAIRSILSLLNIFLPLIAGLLINSFGYVGLFVVTTFFYLLSLLPLIHTTNTKIDYSHSYSETISECFSEKYIKDFFIHFLSGAESILILAIWPIIIGLTFNNNATNLGIFMSLTLIVTFFISLIIGKLSDGDKKNRILKIGSFLYGFGWLLKLFAIAPINVFISIIYQNIAESIMKTPYESYWYSKEASKGDKISGYVVVRDIGKYLGKVFSSFLLIIILTSININNIIIQPQDTLLFGFICFMIIGILIGKNTIFIKEENNISNIQT